MGFLDAAFLPSRASFYITFLNNCGEGESLRTAIYVQSAVLVSKDRLPVRHFTP